MSLTFWLQLTRTFFSAFIYCWYFKMNEERASWKSVIFLLSFRIFHIRCVRNCESQSSLLLFSLRPVSVVRPLWRRIFRLFTPLLTFWYSSSVIQLFVGRWIPRFLFRVSFTISISVISSSSYSSVIIVVSIFLSFSFRKCLESSRISSYLGEGSTPWLPEDMSFRLDEANLLCLTCLS